LPTLSCATVIGRSAAVPKSVLEAIREGIWDFEPLDVAADDYEGTDAMPGTRGKLQILAERLQCGLPLWHPDDRDDAEAPRVGKPR
jgi:hypothetical protein